LGKRAKSSSPRAASARISRPLYARVRAVTGPLAEERGFREVQAERIEVTDPMDDSRVLDVWHEITWAQEVIDAPTAVQLARWALSVEKYVGG